MALKLRTVPRKSPAAMSNKQGERQLAGDQKTRCKRSPGSPRTAVQLQGPAGARRAESRREAEQEGRRDGDRRGETQDDRIRAEVERQGNGELWKQGHNQAAGPRSESYSAACAGKGQQHGFH